MTIGDRIKAARKAAKITQKDLSLQIGVTCSVISKYENGVINPPASQIQAIATALNVPIETLYGLSDAKKPYIKADILQSTIEALRDLQAYYEADACALARIGSQEATERAQERLEAADGVRTLFNYYIEL